MLFKQSGSGSSENMFLIATIKKTKKGVICTWGNKTFFFFLVKLYCSQNHFLTYPLTAELCVLCVRAAAAAGDANEEPADGSKPAADGAGPAEDAGDPRPVWAATGREVPGTISLCQHCS